MPKPSQATSTLLARFAFVALAGIAVSCQSNRDPAGEFWVANGTALRSSLAELAQLENTKVHRVAQETLQDLPECEILSRYCPTGVCPSGEPFSCEIAPALQELNLLEGGWDWIYQRPLEEGHHLQVRGARSADGVTRGEVRIPKAALAESFLAPAEEAPAAAFSTPQGRFLHLLLRPERGLDIASLVADEGWSARLFALKSELFAATTLEGSIELAMYRAEPGRVIPLTVLAVSITDRARTRSAMEQFIHEIQQRWPVETHQIEGQEGQCLTNLDLLPDLSPCYILTEKHLVIGWNFQSLLASVANSAGEPFAVASSHLEIDFAELTLADSTLREATSSQAPPLVYPWSALRVAAVPDQNTIYLRFETMPRQRDPQ